MRKLIILLIATLLSWLCFVAGSIWYKGRTDYAQKSDCIIVLGAAAYHTNPSPVFRARIDHAIALYQQGLAPYIIFTGGFGTGAAFAESEVAFNYATKHGIPNSAVLIETQSRSTVENLEQAKQLMQNNHLSSAIIVSDPLHLKRAHTLANTLDINAVTSPTPSSLFKSFSAKLKFLVRETYFYHYYLFTKN